MRRLSAIASLAVILGLAVFLAHCGGGGSAAKGLTATGQASSGFAPTASSAREKSALDDGFAWISRAILNDAWASLPGLTPIVSAHVNVCSFQNGKFSPLPAHPTVLSSSTGNFSVSVSYNDAQKYAPLFICATDMFGDEILTRPIPSDALPQDANQVTTVALNPDLNGTVIAQFACSSQALFYNKNTCNVLTKTQITSLDGAITAFYNANIGLAGTVGPNSLTSFIAALFADPTAGPIFTTYCGLVTGLTPSNCNTSAQGSPFSPSTTKLPPPQNAGANSFDGTYTGTYSGSCSPGGGVGGGFTMTIANGAISGNSGGGPLAGSVDGSGVAAVAGAVQGANGCSFSGTFTATATAVSAAGSWNCSNPVCSGGWGF